MQTETMIAVDDVEASSAWYQKLLGCRSDHGGPYFDRLVDADSNVLLLLHHWGADNHPSMLKRPDQIGEGLVLYFRVDDPTEYEQRAKQIGANLLSILQYNPIAHQDEFSLRDPSGYLITICGPAK